MRIILEIIMAVLAILGVVGLWKRTEVPTNEKIKRIEKEVNGLSIAGLVNMANSILGKRDR